MTVASIWGLVALRLADDEILPFDYVSYASELKVLSWNNLLFFAPVRLNAWTGLISYLYSFIKRGVQKP